MFTCSDGRLNRSLVNHNIFFQAKSGHALNFAVSNTVRKVKLLDDTLDTTSEISKLLKYSPKRDTMFEKLKKELAPETPGFRTFCPTR